MWYPRPEDVFALHEAILARTGGEPGVLSRGAVASALHRAQWGPFEDGGDLAERAALLLRGIVLDHPFADGNKRTALEATDLFLRGNDSTFDAKPQALLDFMLWVAREAPNVTEITAWVRAHVRKLQEAEGSL